MKYNCIIPICGSASRMGFIPKFILPLPNKNTLLKNHITCLRNIFHCIIITTPDYANIIFNYLKKFFDLNDFKILITETKNMSETILSINYEKDKIYSMIMPDTYFKDTNLMNEMLKMYHRDNCDIVLGIFKIRDNQKGKLGQVLFDEKNNLLDVIDKDSNCEYIWAWGTILWNNKFSKYIDRKKSHIGYGLMPSLNDKLKIKVCKSDSQYYDCGTLNEYKELLNTLNI